MLWVHGGGYRAGDKRNQVRDKVTLFNARGWVFVSINYRLTKPGIVASAQYPDHYDDVAAAVGWVHEHIADYGGDPSRLALLGHSAGADIVANVAADPKYLGTVGQALAALRCAGPLDTEGFDKVAAGPTTRGQWDAALGNEANYLVSTSATRIIEPGRDIPPTIGVVRGSLRRRQIESGYLDALRAAGVSATAIDAGTLSHEAVNRRIGAPGDTVMTPPLMNFLTTCFEK